MDSEKKHPIGIKTHIAVIILSLLLLALLITVLL